MRGVGIYPYPFSHYIGSLEEEYEIKLILTRHGETIWNTEGRVQGVLDSPLTEKGLQQAQRLAKRLKNEGITHIYSSDLPRAIHTADEIRKELQLAEVIQKEEMRELCFGEWEGQAWKELRGLFPDLFKDWDQGPHLVQIPGGENMTQVTERAWNFIQNLLQIHPADTVCIVTHGITLQLLVKKLLGIPIESWENVPWQYNTAVNVFEFLEDGKVNPIVIADHSHIEVVL